jgi:mono/diheme cytochrome c family protein
MSLRVTAGRYSAIMRLPFLDRLFRPKPTAPQKPRYAPRRRRVLVTEEDDDEQPPQRHQGFLSDRRSKFILIASIVAIVTTGIVMTIEKKLASMATDAQADRPAQVAMGRALYRQHCSYCHGAEREGNLDWVPGTPVSSGLAPPLDERSPAVEMSDRQIFEITKFGGQPFLSPGSRSYMPAFEFNLTDAQIWAVIAYFKWRWTDEALARHEAANKAAAP